VSELQLRTSEWTEEELFLREQYAAGRAIVVNMSRAKDAPHLRLQDWLKKNGGILRVDNKSAWGNPHNDAFRAGEITREESVRRYITDLDPELERSAAKVLAGSALGCWCKPKLCHADYLCALANHEQFLPPPPPADLELRQQVREYASKNGDRYSARLFDLWDEWNEKYFDGRMAPAVILLGTPGATTCYGDCASHGSIVGCTSEIRIRRSILLGTLRDLRKGTKDPKGLQLFLEDVLLHEMIHQWQFEISGDRDESWSGHGPAFSAKANEIGRRLGLPTVGRTCKARDRKKGEPSPSQWPHNVRPHPEYYRGAHVPGSKDDVPEELLESMHSIVATYGAGHALTLSGLLQKHGSKSFLQAITQVTAELPEGTS